MRGIQSLTPTTSSNSSTTTTNTASSMISNSSSLSSNNANVQRADWESLRKQARQLENEIDSKLVGFSKLCSNIATSSITNRSSSQQQSQSAAQSSADLLFPTLSNEIEDSLKKLNLINGKMSDSISNGTTLNGGDTNDYTLQRHRDILRDYSHEYEKTKRNIISYKEREKLLSPAHSSHTNNQSNLNNRGGQSNSNATSLYMKEYDHLKSSHNLIDQQLEIAELTKENLQSQRNNLRMIQQKMNTLAHKFPLINSLVQRAKLKKRKDSIILAIVISICLFLMLLYVF